MNDVANRSLLNTLKGHDPFRTVLVDPPWRFQNRTGKMAPEHLRLARYPTMTLDEIQGLPVQSVCDDRCHLYLWGYKRMLWMKAARSRAAYLPG